MFGCFLILQAMPVPKMLECPSMLASGDARYGPSLPFLLVSSSCNCLTLPFPDFASS